MRCLARSIAVFSFLLLCSCFAQAQQERAVVIVEEGSVRIAQFNSNVIFSFGNAARGFSVSNVDHPPGRGDDGSFLGCMPCAPGSQTSINANFVGEETMGYGPATINGVKYERLYYSGTFTLNAPPVILPLEIYPLHSVSVPFNMRGYLQGYATSQKTVPSGSPLFAQSFKGQGIATLTHRGFPFPFLPYYQFAEITYKFTGGPPQRKGANRQRPTRNEP